MVDEMCLNNNEFKQVVKFESYEVCKCGIIRKRDKSKRVLKQTMNNNYLSVKIYSGINNKWYRKYVHRIVAEAFCSGNFKGAVINHIDGNKLNNYYKNLEFTTAQKNCTHLDRHIIAGINNRRPIVAIKDGDILQFDSITEAVEKMNFSASGISQAINGYIKKYKGYTWYKLSDLIT